MTWKRVLGTALLVAGLGAGLDASYAEDPAPAPAPAPAPEPPPKAAMPEKQKESYFGKKFALYVETRGGVASFDALDNPVTTTTDEFSQNQIRPGGGKTGQFTIGWTLPRDRGQYLFTFTGLADDSYELDAEARQRSYIDPSGAGGQALRDELPWWHVRVKDGVLHTTQVPPTWNSVTDDANGNGIPDPNEITYPATTVDLTAPVSKSLNSRLATYDLTYRRDFGGVRYHARWTAGVRYFTFDGSLPTPAWVMADVGRQGVGFTDGVQNQFLIMSQSTSGWGPMGAGEMQFNFRRRQFQIYLLVQAAFLVESLKTDSGSFTYLAGGSAFPNAVVPGQGHISDDLAKTAWNLAFEAGFRVRVADGFHIFISWNRTGYLDTLLVPTILSVPANSTQFDQGTSAAFTTRDIVISSANFGLSFQF
jgi:hypothetical protein